VAIGYIWELVTLYRISARASSPHSPRLLDDFIIAGRGSAGRHLCIVLPLFGGDVGTLVTACKKRFPLPLVKRIVLHVFRGLAHAHASGIVHTDIKRNNIFYTASMGTDSIDT
jgi:serine/threonine protein kinase